MMTLAAYSRLAAALTSFVKEERKASLAVAMDAALAGDTNALGKIERDLGRARFTKPQLGKVARVLASEGRVMEAVLVLTIRHSLESALEELAPAPVVAVGDIFVASWGYDQTNLDWYEIVAVLGPSMVKVREIGAVEFGRDDMMPSPGRFIGDAFKARVGKGYRGQAYINDERDHHAYAWDGTPHYATPLEGGH